MQKVEQSYIFMLVILDSKANMIFLNRSFELFFICSMIFDVRNIRVVAFI